MNSKEEVGQTANHLDFTKVSDRTVFKDSIPLSIRGCIKVEDKFFRKPGFAAFSEQNKGWLVRIDENYPRGIWAGSAIAKRFEDEESVGDYLSKIEDKEFLSHVVVKQTPILVYDSNGRFISGKA